MPEANSQYGPPPDGHDYDKSSLSLWVWDLVGPELLANGRMDASVGGVNLPDYAASAYERALAQLPGELAGFLGGRLQSQFTAYTGRIGEVASTGITAVTGGLAGYALPTRQLGYGYLSINRLGILLNGSATDVAITLSRYDGPVPGLQINTLGTLLSSSYLSGVVPELLKTWALDVAPNDTRTYAVSPVRLPLDGSVYVLSYALPTGVVGIYPKNNQISCGCGGKDATLDKLFMQPLRSLNGNLSHGLILDVSAGCDFTGVVCDLLLNNQFNAALGYLLYYKSGLNVLDDLLGGRLSPAVQVNTDQILARQKEWSSEMAKYMNWLMENFSADMLPAQRCYTCSKSGSIYRSSLYL